MPNTVDHFAVEYLFFFFKALYLLAQALFTHDARCWITDILVVVVVISSLRVSCCTIAALPN